MRKLIYAGLALVGVLVVLVLALPMLVSTDTVREALIAAVKDKTGRTLSIDGDLSFSLLPNVHVSAGKVVLSNPPEFGSAPFASMERMEIKVGLIAALTGNMSIDGFVLVKPKIRLMVDKAGRNNWSFGAPGGVKSTSKGSTGPDGVPFGLFAISQGELIYSNAQKASKHTFADINLNVTLPSLSDTLNVVGDLVWNGEKMTLALSLATPSLFKGGSSAKLDLKLAGKQLSATLSGDVSKQADGFKFANVRLAGDGMVASGNLSLKQGQLRPYVSAAFKLDQLNLSKYAGKEGAKKTNKKAGWSRQEIDFSGLKAIDGDFKLVVGRVLYESVKTGAANLSAKLRNGVLTANLPALALYDGTVKMAMSVDGRKATPVLKSIGVIKNVNALPFLRDAAKLNKIEGRANLDFNLTSTGKSQHAIMSALKGGANVNFQNGALLGIDIASILRSVQSGKTSGFAKGGKTPFGSLVANYKFRKGVGTNRNFKMSGGQVIITGGGRVTVPRKTLSYRVNPSLAGKGGISVLGINVPIIIAGPWANPRVYPDLPGILDTPEMALKGLTSIGEGGTKGILGIVDKINPIGSGSGDNPVGKIIKAPFKKLF